MASTVYETYARDQAGVAKIAPSMRKNSWPGSVAYLGPMGDYVGKVSEALQLPGKRTSSRAGYVTLASADSAASFHAKQHRFGQMPPADIMAMVPLRSGLMRVVSRVEPEEPITKQGSAAYNDDGSMDTTREQLEWGMNMRNTLKRRANTGGNTTVGAPVK